MDYKTVLIESDERGEISVSLIRYDRLVDVYRVAIAHQEADFDQFDIPFVMTPQDARAVYKALGELLDGFEG